MEKLIVENFLAIKKAELDVTRFTVIIGPQASGKSVLAKLVHFFRTLLRNEFFQAAQNQEADFSLSTQAKSTFISYFPSYGWREQEFEIKFQVADVWVKVRSTGKDNDEPLITFSRNLTSLYHTARKQFSNALIKEEEDDQILDATEIVIDQLLKKIQGLGIETAGTFIPASRSFFAHLQTSFFTLSSNGFVLDPLLQRFGSMYESAKRRSIAKPEKSNTNQVEIRDFERESEAVIVGRYQRVKAQDWIENSDGRSVRLQHASSGQQESLPMLLVLADRLRVGNPWRFIIEEPEAHLFPAAQRNQVNLLSILYSAGIECFLTTHSPYILSALNVLVQADDVIRQKPLVEEQVRKLLGHGRPISFDDLRVYALKDGQLTLEMNSENKLIGENVIDAVSTEFEHIFNELLTLQYPPDEVE